VEILDFNELEVRTRIYMTAAIDIHSQPENIKWEAFEVLMKDDALWDVARWTREQLHGLHRKGLMS